MDEQFRRYKENKSHGTPQFPFILYKMCESNSKINISYHWHEEMEIIYVVAGTLYLDINCNQYIGKAHDIFFVNREELHSMHAEDKSTLYYAIVFLEEQFSFERMDFVEKEYIEPILHRDILFPSKFDISSSTYEKVENYLNEIIEMNEKTSPAYQLGTKVTLLSIFYQLIAANSYIALKDSDSRKNNAKIKLQKDMIQYLGENYSHKIPLEEISKHFLMSPKYFCRFFKANFHQTFIEYLNNVRIEKAMRLLSDTTIPVTEIAALVGFDNLSYFSRKYKAVVGCMPREYRRNGLGNSY